MSLEYLVLSWIPAIALVLFTQWHRAGGGCGLTLAYVANLAIIHWAGATIYLFSDDLPEPATTAQGFVVATVGVWAFAIGGWLATSALPRQILDIDLTKPLPSGKMIRTYVGVGVMSFTLLRSLESVPTVTSLVAAGQQFIIPALCLGCWKAWQQKNMKQLSAWLVTLVLLPFFTIMVLGFIGYGALAALTVVIFISTFLRPRRYIICAGILLAYVSLSVWVTYSRDRVEIRNRVWGEDSATSRVQQLASTFSNFEWLDPSNSDHLSRINDRLNQNYLVGKVVQHVDLTGQFANGETLADAALALVPRVLWPDKPVSAGSGNVVADWTDLTFAQDTSVGIGHVMEFYINFGKVGVAIGFSILGAVLALIDEKARKNLYSGDYGTFILLYTPALTLLQVGGSFVELTAAMAAAWAMAKLIAQFDLLGSVPEYPHHASGEPASALPELTEL